MSSSLMLGIQTDPRAPFPDLIDNTMRSAFISCERKFFWEFIRKLGPLSPSIHLHAGGAFAAGLEAAKRAYWEQNLSVDDSLRLGLETLIKFYGPIQLEPARNADKSCENVIRAYDSYFSRYPISQDPLVPVETANGRRMLEFTFAIPTEVMHPVTGAPILYGGRADSIGLMHGTLWISDEKTASALGEQWADQWNLDSQFTGYAKAAQDYGYPVAGALVRGIGLLKTKITHAEAMVYRKAWEIERWWEQLHRDLRRMVAAWEEYHFSQALSKGACSAYGGCLFRTLCSSQTPEAWTATEYRPRNWNPLAKDSGEKLLENKEVMSKLESPDLHIPGLPDFSKPIA